MLFFPCLSIKAIISIAQSFVIFALLVHTTQAGVIKKRDLSEIETTTLSTRLSQNETDFKELKVAPTILTPLTNESATTKLKLQPVSSNNFGFEHSKEFSNNEILFNTALKQKELKSFNQTNSAQNEENSKPSSTKETEAEIKPDREQNNLKTTTELKSHLNSEKEQKNQVSSSEGIFVKEENKVLNNINEKLETLSPITTTTEFSSNAIKEEKIQKNVELETESEKKLENTKLTDRFKQIEFSATETSQDNAEVREGLKEHSESLENSLNTRESNPRPPSQILTELKLEMEATTETNKNLNGDQLEDQLMQETTETKQVVITELPLEEKVNQDRREQLTTTESSNLNTHQNNGIKMEEIKSEIFSHDTENKLNLEESASTIKPQIQETLTSSQDSLKPLINSTDILSKPQREEFLTSSQDSSKPLINSTSVLSNPQIKEIVTSSQSSLKTSINFTDILSQGKDHLNSINDGLDREVLKEVTTVLPIITEKSSLAEGNKMEYARSMFNEELKEESSTFPLRADNEIFINTTPKPVVLSIKEGLKEVEKENLGESLRESNKENFQSNTEGLRETEKESIKEGLKEVEKENLGESLGESNKENFQSNTEGVREMDKENLKESLRQSSKESFLEHQSSTEGLRDPAKEETLRQSNKEVIAEHRFSTENLNELAKEELKESLRVNNNDKEGVKDHQSFTESLKEFTKANSKESLEENNKESLTKQKSLKEGNLREHFEHQSFTESLKELGKENFQESFVNSEKESFTESSLESLNESNKNEVKDLTSKEKDSYVGEKKPKFINDNSTNAQQMNLPNNAEVWYLAAMKSLPKANVTMETAPKHNNSTELKEENLQNTTYTLNTNSEKNLLDWSLIMQNKELATTARSQNLQEKSQDEEEDSGINQLTNEEKVSTTIEEVLEKGKFSETPQQSVTQPSIQSREDMINIKPLLEQQQEILEITTIMPNSTILSSTTTDNTENDKRPMNNQIEISTSVAEFENNTSKSPSILTNQTSADIEPNLNEINLTSNQMLPHKNDELNITATESTTGNTNNVDANVAVDVAAAATTSTTTERALVTSTESTAGNNNNDVDMTTLEQNSIELTTLSSLVSAKQNASQFNNANVIEQQQQNNVISEESTQKVFEEPKKDTADILQKNNFQNIDLNTKIPTTTSEIPITTFRPKNLAKTSTTTTLPPSVRQEIDQNGNEIVEKQSINALEEDRNNSKTIETHLSELENIETTTLETIKQENTTSSAKDDNDDKIVHEQIQKLDEGKIALTTQATPKLEEDVTTIGSPVKETKFEKDKEIETTTTTLKTPVVEKEQRKNVEESSTIATLTEENKIDTKTTKETEKDLEKDLEKVTENPLNSHLENELTTMGSYPVNTTAKKENEETLIKLLDDTSTTTTETISFTTTTTTLAPPTSIPFPTTKFSTDSIESSVATESSSSFSTTISPLPITTKIEEIYKVIHTSTTEAIQTTTSHILTETTAEEDSSYSSTTSSNNMIPITTSSPASTKMIDSNDIEKSLPTLTSIMTGSSGNMYPKNSDGSGETDVNVIIAITVSVIGVVALILLVGFLYIMRKRQKQTSFSNRCRPVSLDEYTIDNGSVGGSIRKSSALRSSKRTYGNLAFDDPSLRHNAMGVHELAKFVQEKLRIFEEFRDVPQITSRLDEVPQGCEDKNRYANVLPLPETRVILQRLNDDDKTEYINANYVTGPKDPPNYYIACQAPLDTTVEDFWRMIWEQQSRVIIQATDLIENGVEKCAEYLPPSVTLDNHSTFGDFQITLQNREVKDKYAISTILLKHVTENVTRELTHFWYKWPEVGVPAEEAPIIAMLLEARSSLISYAIEQANEDKEKSSTATLKSAEEGTANGTSPSKDSNGSSSANGSNGEINGNISMVPIKKTARNQGPLTIHCSPGTGRTGTIIACDIAIRSLETPKRTVDIPQIVFYVRRGRASAVLTKEQYEFIYKVANMYAAKISNPTNYN